MRAGFPLRGIPLVLLTATLCAQRTWIVDAANGAGTDFTDLPPAVAAAVDGDRIIVRAGSYSSTNIDETLTILGEGVVTLGALNISGLSAADAVVVKRVRSTTLSVLGNAGRIHLEQFTGLSLIGLSQRIDGTRLITCNDCTFRDALNVTDSTAVFTDCRMSAPIPTRFGMTIGDAHVTIVGGEVRGIDENCAIMQTPPGEAIWIRDSELVATGDGTLIQAGADNPNCGPPASVPGVRAVGSVTVRQDPGAVIAGTNDVPIAGSFTLINERLTAVTAKGAPPGGTIRSDVYAQVGTLSVLLISVSTFDLPTPFGKLWVAPANFAIDAGVIDASQHRIHDLPVGASWMRGLSVALQAATLPPAAGLDLSEAVIVVLD